MDFIVGLSGQSLTDAEKDLLQHEKVTGCVFLGPQCQSIKDSEALIKAVKILKPDIDIMLDHEGGEIIRFKESIVHFDSARSWLFESDIDLACEKMSKCICEPLSVLRDMGFDRVLAPCVDVHSDVSTIIGQRGRAFSHKIDEIVTLAKVWIDVCNKIGLKTCLKHWPGHGSSEHDSHIETAFDTRSSDEIWADAIVYKQLIDQGYQDAIMPGHVVYPEIDDLPATLSNKIISNLKSWGFRGKIMSDCFSMLGAGKGTLRDRAVLAKQAGITDFMILSSETAIDLIKQFYGDELTNS